jgi:hypothetical protein
MRRGILAGLGLFLAAGWAALALAKEEKVTVKGELVDSFCYATMGARGASHHDCGVACAKKGIAVGLLEEGNQKLHVLLPEKDKGRLPDAVLEKVGSTVTVTGQAHTAGGVSFVTVESVK